MAIQLTCPNCQRDVTVSPENAACPECATSIALPTTQPKQLGCFLVERLAGQSTLWSIYLGRDTGRQDVLLKVLEPSFALNQGHIAAFYAAIAQITALRSPQIQRMLDCGESAGQHYAALRYVPGDTLDERMAREGRLPEYIAVEIARDIAEALEM